MHDARNGLKCGKIKHWNMSWTCFEAFTTGRSDISAGILRKLYMYRQGMKRSARREEMI
jgi:hypothetical protein